VLRVVPNTRKHCLRSDGFEPPTAGAPELCPAALGEHLIYRLLVVRLRLFFVGDSEAIDAYCSFRETVQTQSPQG
jgi:hypothetical protein